MDFSIFKKEKKEFPKSCEIIVVDFLNKKELYRVTVDNKKPIPVAVQEDLENASKLLERIMQAPKVEESANSLDKAQ